MANELPYFRFTVQAWQNGKISIEDYSLKGLFIDVCGYYWVQDCSINLAMLEKRFRDAKDLLYQLIDLEIIKKKEDYISIDFLDEQFDLLSEKRQKRAYAGKLGGLSKSSNAKAKLQQNPSYKDKDKDKIKEDKNMAVAKKLELYISKNKESLAEIFKDYPSLKKHAMKWLEYKFKAKGYSETGWAKTMIKRINTTSEEFIKNRIDETIDNETGNKDYFYANHQVEYDKSIGKSTSNIIHAKKTAEKTLEELRNS